MRPVHDASEFDRFASRVVEAKKRILRLVRAVGELEVDLGNNPAIAEAFERMAEYDTFLTRALDLLDREGRGEARLSLPMDRLLAIEERVRGDVVDALDDSERRRLPRALEGVVASDPEVWLEVEALRGFAEEDPTERGRESARRRARGVLTALEGTALPGPSAPLPAWFEASPLDWIEVTARLHGLPLGADAGCGTAVDAHRRDLVSRLCERLSDEAWLRRYLVESLSARERGFLAFFLETEEGMTLSRGRSSLKEALRVDLDWRTSPPVTAGGKLRAAGFVHLGTIGDVRVAAVPAGLRATLKSALLSVDPDAVAQPAQELRAFEARMLDGQEFADGHLDGWKKLDRKLTKRFERWAFERESGGDSWEAALDVVFAGAPRDCRSEAEELGLFEFAFFDWRPLPDGRSRAERRIASGRFSTSRERAFAQGIASARPAVYRVGTPRRGVSVPLTPIFPPGPPVVVTDRALSLTAEEGWFVAARVYPAGPFHFVQVLGDPLPAEMEGPLRARLARERRTSFAAGGPDDPADLVRARPQVVIRAVRALRRD